MKPDTFDSLHKITMIFEKFQELSELMRSLSKEEKKMLVASLENSLEEESK